MSIEKNIEIVKRFTEEVVNNQKFELVDDLWTVDMQWHGGFMGEISGIENYKKFLTSAVDGSFVNMHLQIKDIIAQEDKVLLYFSNSGKNVKDFLGYKATGREAIWNGMSIYRIENGKIAEAWYSEDLLMMFVQLNFIKFNQ